MHDRYKGKYGVPEMFQHILMRSLNVTKEGVFNDIEMASKAEFSDKDLLTRN